MINLELTYKENKFSYKGIDFDIIVKSTKNKIIMSIIKSEEYIKNNFNTSLEDILIELEFSIPMDYFDFDIGITNIINYTVERYLHKFIKLSRHNKFKKQYNVNIDISNSDSKYFKDFLIAKFISDDIKTLFSERFDGNRLFCNRIKFLDITENKYIEEKLEYIYEDNFYRSKN